MSKIPPIPQLSIVVPIGSDLAAFESTLISVLENQPRGSEIIVAHDGSYDDPFDLCNEVRFVTADSHQMVDLVSAGARASRARFVHVLADGLRATLGWAEEALESFEQFDVGAVAPVIRSANDGRVLSAGWRDRPVRLCDNASKVSQTVSPELGVHLQASFWRRDILRSLVAVLGRDRSTDPSYLIGLAIQQAGWQCGVAANCDVRCDGEQLPWDRSSFGRGKRLRETKNAFDGGGWLQAISAAMIAMLSNALEPQRWSESLGQAAALGTGHSDQWQLDAVPACGELGAVVSLPAKGGDKKKAA